MYEHFAYIYVTRTVCMQCLWRPEEGVGSPGTGITDGCWPPVGVGNWTQVLQKCTRNH